MQKTAFLELTTDKYEEHFRMKGGNFQVKIFEQVHAMEESHQHLW